MTKEQLITLLEDCPEDGNVVLDGPHTTDKYNFIDLVIETTTTTLHIHTFKRPKASA